MVEQACSGTRRLHMEHAEQLLAGHAGTEWMATLREPSCTAGDCCPADAMHGWLQGLSSGFRLGLAVARAHVSGGRRGGQGECSTLLSSVSDLVAAEMLPWAQQRLPLEGNQALLNQHGSDC